MGVYYQMSDFSLSSVGDTGNGSEMSDDRCTKSHPWPAHYYSEAIAVKNLCITLSRRAIGQWVYTIRSSISHCFSGTVDIYRGTVWFRHVANWATCGLNNH